MPQLARSYGRAGARARACACNTVPFPVPAPVPVPATHLTRYVCPNESELARLTSMPAGSRAQVLAAARSLQARGAQVTKLYSLLPTPYCLLPTTYFLCPTPCSQLPTPYSPRRCTQPENLYFLLPAAHFLLPTSCCPLFTAHFQLPTPHSPHRMYSSPWVLRVPCSSPRVVTSSSSLR